MAKAIIFHTPSVARAWRKLPQDVQAALREKVEAYADERHAGIVKALPGQDGIRLRAGDYRVVVAEDPPGTLRIVAAGHRRDVYR